MKKEFRRHLQKYCDISNWSRMHKPRTGKENYERGQALAEDIICMMISNEPGYDGTAIMLTALALVNSYVRKAVCYSNAYDMNEGSHLKERYDNLFESDWWMGFREDSVQFQIEDFIRGGEKSYAQRIRR